MLIRYTMPIAGDNKVQTATHVLQFVYLGNTGFRFPIAHYPTREVDPSTLYIKFWEIVGWLEMAGFSVIYCCCDGGQANRSFIQMHFKGKDPVKEKYTTTNIHTGQPLVFFLDSSVSLLKCCKNIKKLSTLSGTLICGVCTIDYLRLYNNLYSSAFKKDIMKLVRSSAF